MSSNTIPADAYMAAPSLTVRTMAIARFTARLDPATTPADAECTICLESLAATNGHTPPQAQAQVAPDHAVKPVCGHAAHHACLLRWTQERSNCPYCRQEMFVKKIEKPLRKFAIPFESGEFLISEAAYRRWLEWCESDEEYRRLREFREVWDEKGLAEYVKVE